MPTKWKEAIVKMIPKPIKDHTDPNGFRPISLINTFSKLLERIIQKGLVDWINSNKIISDFQSGFRKLRQTLDHLIRLLQKCLESFNKNKNLGAIFIDIEKAFDKVWHKGLLFELNKLQIPNYLGLWLKNYLNKRLLRVKIDSELSEAIEPLTGVPQGSVLGPILFNLYFNDITEIDTQAELALFADDLASWTVAKSSRIIEERLICMGCLIWAVNFIKKK
ncbi:unnamed protein product [Brachionus calyciflorus]|uniref:Reverse transcriptase domain-containing protein n=1 Tax=Brachionus calyciflorus TaxID=104777 RepID=A0A814GQE5_9BILA|nr:unnamed protein product [Brachionus calyciflorus]